MSWCRICPGHTLVFWKVQAKDSSLPALWVKVPALLGTFLSTTHPACESYPTGSQGLSHNQNWLYFAQSPKGFLESYEEMLSYALRPETWATTRLELEGRGVSLLMLSSWGSSELRSFCWERCINAKQLRWLGSSHSLMSRTGPPLASAR